MKNLILVFILLTTLAGKIKRGRVGLHGMVIYGQKGSYFLDHIPMESSPHDLQVVSEVAITTQGGKDLNIDLSNNTFTMRPSSFFSLDDFAAGKIETFAADIYKGGFEQGGEILIAAVKVRIKSVLLNRKIPSKSGQTSYEFADYWLNVITPARNFQKIVNLKTGKVLWCVKGPEFYEYCD